MKRIIISEICGGQSRSGETGVDFMVADIVKSVKQFPELENEPWFENLGENTYNTPIYGEVDALDYLTGEDQAFFGREADNLCCDSDEYEDADTFFKEKGLSGDNSSDWADYYIYAYNHGFNPYDVISFDWGKHELEEYADIKEQIIEAAEDLELPVEELDFATFNAENETALAAK